MLDVASAFSHRTSARETRILGALTGGHGMIGTDASDRLDRTGVSPLAGKPPDPSMLVNIPRLVAAYYTERPDPSVPEQRVSFGTSGHRGSSFTCSFNEWHVLAIAQAICRLPASARASTARCSSASTPTRSPSRRSAARWRCWRPTRSPSIIAVNDDYTPTPAVSHAILTYNRGRTTRPRRRHRHHAVAQSAGRWRLQVQPAARRAGRRRHDGVRSRPRPTSC